MAVADAEIKPSISSLWRNSRIRRRLERVRVSLFLLLSTLAGMTGCRVLSSGLPNQDGGTTGPGRDVGQDQADAGLGSDQPAIDAGEPPGLLGPPAVVGCADGTREGFRDFTVWQDIAGFHRGRGGKRGSGTCLRAASRRHQREPRWCRLLRGGSLRRRMASVPRRVGRGGTFTFRRLRRLRSRGRAAVLPGRQRRFADGDLQQRPWRQERLARLRQPGRARIARLLAAYPANGLRRLPGHRRHLGLRQRG